MKRSTFGRKEYISKTCNISLLYCLLCSDLAILSCEYCALPVCSCILMFILQRPMYLHLYNCFFSNDFGTSFRHLIGFFLFLSLTIYTAMRVPEVVDLRSFQHLPDFLRRADLHNIRSVLLNCLPSLPNMPNLNRLTDELKTSLPSMDFLSSLSGWHVLELLSNCLPERFSPTNQTSDCVLVRYCSLSLFPTIIL